MSIWTVSTISPPRFAGKTRCSFQIKRIRPTKFGLVPVHCLPALSGRNCYLCEFCHPPASRTDTWDTALRTFRLGGVQSNCSRPNEPAILPEDSAQKGDCWEEGHPSQPSVTSRLLVQVNRHPFR